MTKPAAQTAAILDLTARIRAAAPVRLGRGDTVVVGQRVCEDREGRSGVVVAVEAGCCTVVLQDGASVHVYADMLAGGPGAWSAREDVAHSDEVALFVGMAAARKSAEKRAREAAAAARVAEGEDLKLAHPDLEVGSYRDSAAKNMRKLLRAAFPGVKISVTQARGSMVPSIDVTWTGGPERSEVAAICRRFESSYFDGMTDSTVSKSTAWTDTFGGCSGVFLRREG